MCMGSFAWMHEGNAVEHMSVDEFLSGGFEAAAEDVTERDDSQGRYPLIRHDEAEAELNLREEYQFIPQDLFPDLHPLWTDIAFHWDDSEL